jgi:hypothetical protein
LSPSKRSTDRQIVTASVLEVSGQPSEGRSSRPRVPHSTLRARQGWVETSGRGTRVSPPEFRCATLDRGPGRDGTGVRRARR